MNRVVGKTALTAATIAVIAGVLPVGSLAAAADEVPGSGPGRTILHGGPGSDRGVIADGTVRRIGGKVYFIGHDAEHGPEPWVTDGTAAGTRMLADVRPGPEGSWKQVFGLWGDRVLVGSRTKERATDLWSISPNGTAVKLARDVRSGPSWTSTGFDILAAGDRLYFTGNDNVGENDYEPWVSDGTPEGTHRLVDLAPGIQGSSPGGYGLIGDTVVFAASTPEHGRELWTTDGTAQGTAMISDPSAGPDDSVLANMTWAGERLYYTGVDGTDEDSHGRELWTSDGTAGGTRVVADLNPGVGSAVPLGLTPIANKVVFNGPGSNPWISDGTRAGTYELARPNPGPGGSDTKRFRLYGPADAPRVAFTAATEWTGKSYVYRLFSTDGTRTGTRLMADVRPTGDGSSVVFHPWRDQLIINIQYPRDNGGGTIYNRLWVTDGTSEGTWPFTAPENNFSALSVIGDHAVWYGPPVPSSNGRNAHFPLWELGLNEQTTAPSAWVPPPPVPIPAPSPVPSPTPASVPPPTPTPAPSPTPTLATPAPTPTPSSGPGAVPAPRSTPTVVATIAGAYGRARAHVIITSRGVPARGQVTLFAGNDRIGTSTLTWGRATLWLPARVRPGTTRLTVLYSGGGTAAATRFATTARIIKARPKLRATLKRRDGQAQVSLRLIGAPQRTRAGRIVVRHRGEVIARTTTTARLGRATVRLPHLPRGGRLTISWAGNTRAAPTNTTVVNPTRR